MCQPENKKRFTVNDGNHTYTYIHSAKTEKSLCGAAVALGTASYY